MTVTYAFKNNSPFKRLHVESKYNLTNTTQELLKFQLQEQHRSDKDLSDNRSLKNDNSSGTPENSFDYYLQSKLDQGDIHLDDITKTPYSNDEEFDIENYVSINAHKQSYLNLKLLIESSVLDVSKLKSDSILPLKQLKTLKILRKEKEEVKQYVESKVVLTLQFIGDILLQQGNLPLIDNNLLQKLLKQSNAMQKEWINITEELEEINFKIQNHNLSCILLGYLEDVKRASSGDDLASVSLDLFPQGSSRSEACAENIISHIASIAATKGINLPGPPLASVTPDDQTTWIKKCIDTILGRSNGDSLEHNGGVDSIPTSIPSLVESKSDGHFDSYTKDTSFFSQHSPDSSNDKVISQLKTALNDMRFSQLYLVKEYEHSKEKFNKTLQEYRKKIINLEKELTSSKTANISEDSKLTNHKDKEISKLRKELNILKIDSLKTTGKEVLSPDSAKSYSSISPITGEPLSLQPSDMNVIDELDGQSRLSPTTGAMSNAILRKEFKKIVSDIQDQYEVMLGEERLRRQNLEEELNRMKN